MFTSIMKNKTGNHDSKAYKNKSQYLQMTLADVTTAYNGSCMKYIHTTLACCVLRVRYEGVCCLTTWLTVKINPIWRRW
jgi:hypothetical protein